VLYNTIVNGCLFNQRWEMAAQYTLESFDYKVKIADDIYRNVLDKLTMNYCKLKISLKCDYATKILKELKEKNIRIDDETYQRVARMIFKHNGVKINLNTNVSNEDSYQNQNYTSYDNSGYYGNKKYDNKNYQYYGNKRDTNKDELKWQRKNNNY